MCLRNLSALSKAALFLMTGFALAASAEAAPPAKPTAPANLRLEDVSSYVPGGNIQWDVRRVGSSETKRLIPNGMISKRCLFHKYEDASGKEITERASMKLVPHPNPKRDKEMIVYISLTSKCQERKGDKLIAKQDGAPNFESEDALDETTPLSAAFQNLIVKGEFSGKISVCALAVGGTSVTEIESRLAGNCSELNLQDDGDDLVEDGKSIIGASRRVERAEAKAKSDREKEAYEKSVQDYQDALQATSALSKALCDGNLQAMNKALSTLSGFGVRAREIGKDAIATSLPAWKAELKKAKDFDEIEEIEARFLRAEASLRDETAKKNFRMDLANRYIELAGTNISEIAKMDSAEARTAEANIKTAKQKVKDLLSGKDAKDKLATVEGLSEKLVTKALALGETSKARELAQAGAERTSGAQQLRYIKAERRILEKDFKKCVDKYAEKDSGMEKCDKAKLAASKVQKKLVEAADGVLSEEALSDLKDEGKDLFGRPQGYVMTAFGPVFNQGMMGEFDAYRQKSVYEIMMENMMGSQYAGMGGMQSLLGGQSSMFGGAGARMQSPLMGGVSPMMMGLGGMGQGARGSFGMNQMGQFGQSPMRMF